MYNSPDLLLSVHGSEALKTDDFDTATEPGRRTRVIEHGGDSAEVDPEGQFGNATRSLPALDGLLCPSPSEVDEAARSAHSFCVDADEKLDLPTAIAIIAQLVTALAIGRIVNWIATLA